MKKKVLVLIPARYQSTRFPGKPLALISGISMIARVFQNMQKFNSDEIEFISFVVTDNEKIETHMKAIKGNVVRVDDDVNSGTLRIELAFQRFFKDMNFDLIINVQGDEPLLHGDEILKLAKFHLKSSFDIATMVKKNFIFDGVFFDPNKVKAVLSEVDGRAFYFSRAPIPFKRDQVLDELNDFWYMHVGVYSYKPLALEKFSKFSESRLENLEKLEQLRALENGLIIGAIETAATLVGVDSPDDIKLVEEILTRQ